MLGDGDVRGRPLDYWNNQSFFLLEQPIFQLTSPTFSFLKLPDFLLLRGQCLTTVAREGEVFF